MADYPSCRDPLAIAADMAHAVFDRRSNDPRTVIIDVMVWASGGVTWNLKEVLPWITDSSSGEWGAPLAAPSMHAPAQVTATPTSSSA